MSISGVLFLVISSKNYLKIREKYHPRLLIIVALISVCTIAVFISTSNVSAQQSYDSGAYGGCAYSQGCNTTQPPTVVDVLPSTDNPQPGRAYSVNLNDGQTLDGDRYEVVVTPNFPVGDIKNVAFYVNDELLGVVHESQDGVYVWSWILPSIGSHNFKVIMTLNDDSISTKQFAVNISGKPINGAQDSETSKSTQEGESDTTLQPIDNINLGGSSAMGLISSLLNRVAQATPRRLAYTMPYIVLGLLATLLMIQFYQLRNEVKHIQTLLGLLRRDKHLADEKANFIMLASHYLRTPLTIINGAIDLALTQSTDNTDVAYIKKTKATVAELHTKSEQILSSIEKNKDLAAITTPDIKQARIKLYRSLSFISPIIISALLIIFINLLYILARKVDLSLPNIFGQAILFISLTSLGYAIIKRQQQQREELGKVNQQRKYEESLDQARNRFIQSSADQLAPLVARVRLSFDGSEQLQADKYINQAFSDLQSLIARFTLVSQLERGKIARELTSFELQTTMEAMIGEYSQQIDTKNIKLTKYLHPQELKQSMTLLTYTLRILMDNAIKFSPDSARVTVKASPVGKSQAEVVLRNQSDAIDPERINSLFKPFSRGTSAELASESGVGLSLYLARLITRYLDGDTQINLKNGQVEATVRLAASLEV